MRSRLKGPEKLFRLRHAGAGIAEMDHHQVAFHRGGDAHFANRAAFQSLHAIARQIDEDLQQAVMVGLHSGNPSPTSQISEMPASRSPGSMTMRASSSKVPRSATTASRSEAARRPEDAIFSSPWIRVPSTWY